MELIVSLFFFSQRNVSLGLTVVHLKNNLKPYVFGVKFNG